MKRMSLVITAVLLFCAITIAAHPQYYEGRCVPIQSSATDSWKVQATGIPIPRLVSAPANSAPWGSVIPNTPAQWLYAGSFDTGPMRKPFEVSLMRFRKELGSQLSVFHIQSASIRITADNGYTLWVNGYRIGSTYDSNLHKWLKDPMSAWKTYETYDIKSALQGAQFASYLEVEVADFGGAAGFLLDGQVCAEPGYSQAIPR